VALIHSLRSNSGNVGGYPPRLILAEQLGGRADGPAHPQNRLGERLSAGLARLALLLSCILFWWGIHKSVETVKTLVLFLYEAAIFHFLCWSRNLLGCRRYLLVIAVQTFLALIFNLKAGPQCL
jgi:hypothetical protein